ncbi:Zinc finger CCCH domain-containing protein 3 [Acropora cervicornis]|uniref:Zinc finger CCCH domain-containing protein 3 n=1 Tax=Acropora cervicornis TaxID=6130 RepID=A0AAD9UYQ7_ACRCE|nr:Zinc finger CCCH domain-containing protein 3 [Acropora cervicornis]
MADKSSKLKAQIEVLTNLIKSHEKIKQARDGHASSARSKLDNNASSFSWKRQKQSRNAHQRFAGTRTWSQVKNQTMKEKSSYSLDRRITTPASMSGKVGQNSGSTMKTNLSVLQKSASANQGQAVVSAILKPTVSSMTPALSSHVLFPKKSSIASPVWLSPTKVVKNPYVLNKNTSSSSLGVNVSSEKSKLTQSKPTTTCFALMAASDSKSHSDSELYSKKSSLSNSGKSSNTLLPKGKSRASLKQESASAFSVPGSFKWSTPMETESSSNYNDQKAVKDFKPSRSKLKWTKPGIDSESQINKPKNPYVLKKGSLKRKDASSVSKTLSRPKLAKQATYSSPAKNSRVWMASGSLKLDRRNMQTSMQAMKKRTPSKHSSTSFIQRRQMAVLRDNPILTRTRYNIVRSKRKEAPIKAQGLSKVVVIAGESYKTSSNKLRKTKSSAGKRQEDRKITSLSKTAKIGKLSKTVTIKGEKFAMDSKGKTLQRVNTGPQQTSVIKANLSKQSGVLVGRRRSSNGRRILLCTPTTLVRSEASNSHSKALASRVLRRSIHNARLYEKKKGKRPSEQYCMFYNRFGKCNKQATCPYIHDPSKIAVCTKFLRGRCKNTDGSCPFSHKIDRDKMPVCQFFLRGKCSNDNCPYSHVNVSKKAEVCEDFLKGFCSRGQQCNKKHILECEEFSQTGKCSKGTKCKLMHRTRKSTTSRKWEPTSIEEMASDSLKRPKLEFTNEEGFLPLQATTSDSDAHAMEEPQERKSNEAKGISEPLVIRPRFLKPKEEAN